MNNDLISRIALLQGLGSYGAAIDPYNITRLITQKIIAAPAVDAERLKHGIWEENPNVWECSECHKWLMVTQRTAGMNFCTHCGARMDGGAKDAAD